MSALEFLPNVYWVGVVDWNLRDFHGYAAAPRGTTYNAYLIKGEKTALIDTVSASCSRAFFEAVEEVVPLEAIDYLVVNHVEPDHSGCLTEAVERIRPEKIFCTAMGKAFMLSHYHRSDWPFQVVQTGGSLPLGGKTIDFLELKMLHWPDNMGCYLREYGLLISSDAFGQNWATSERFDDALDFHEMADLMGSYYANIILPFSDHVLKALGRIEELGWPVGMIAPSHGVIVRENVEAVIGLYRKWARQEVARKAVIVYDTMWKSTAAMADEIAHGLIEKGIDVRVFHMKACHHSDVMAEVLDAAAVILGSSTHNNGMLPLMADMVRYMEGLRPKGRIGAVFGSYGWSGEAPKHLAEAMERMRMKVCDVVRVKNVPTESDRAACRDLGRRLAAEIEALAVA